MPSYLVRISLLLLFLGALVLIDHVRDRGVERRLAESAALLAAGILGSAAGVLQDLISVKISPAYFSLGKGLSAWPRVDESAALLGAQAGASFGIVAAGVLLVALPRGASIARGFALLSFRILYLAVLGEMLAILLVVPWDPFEWGERLGAALSTGEAERFLFVHSMHLGLYVGAITGVIWCAIAVRSCEAVPTGCAAIADCAAKPVRRCPWRTR